MTKAKPILRSTAVLALAIALIIPTTASALTYTYAFAPNDNGGTTSDVYDLDHNYLYIWGIKWSIPSNQKIVSATLTIKDIWNWDTNANILKFYLLDNPKINDWTRSTDIISIKDWELTGSPNEIPEYNGVKFSNYSYLTSWSDTDGPETIDQFNYTFSNEALIALSDYLMTPNSSYNSSFGIGFDPDCHYYNNGIALTIDTAPVPEPGTCVLLGAGLLGLGIYGRRRTKK